MKYLKKRSAKIAINSINERLQYLIGDIADGNISRFAKNAGIVPNTIHNYLKGRSPHIDTLINIRRKYNVNIDWLLTGEGERYINNNKEGGESVETQAQYGKQAETANCDCESVRLEFIRLFEDWIEKACVHVNAEQRASFYEMLLNLIRRETKK